MQLSSHCPFLHNQYSPSLCGEIRNIYKTFLGVQIIFVRMHGLPAATDSVHSFTFQYWRNAVSLDRCGLLEAHC